MVEHLRKERRAPRVTEIRRGLGYPVSIPLQYNPVPEDQICAQSVKPVTIVNRSWKSNPGGIEDTLVVRLKLNAARRKREVLAYLEGALVICFWRPAATQQRKPQRPHLRFSNIMHRTRRD
jgi:hypothetical protein